MCNTPALEDKYGYSVAGITSKIDNRVQLLYAPYMDVDLDLYRHELRVSTNPLVRLSAIDISPDHPQRTFVFIHGFGGQAEQWHYQVQNFALENRVIALDMRGHGLSDRPSSGYDMKQPVCDIENALTLLNISRQT